MFRSLVAVSLVAVSLSACQSAHPEGDRFIVDGVTYQMFEGVRWQACLWEDAQGPCLWDNHIDSDGFGSSYLVHADGSVEWITITDFTR